MFPVPSNKNLQQKCFQLNNAFQIRWRICEYSQGEGAAYRGRVLVELSTKLDGKPDKSVEEISSDDILVVQVWPFVEFPFRVVFHLKPIFTALCFFSLHRNTSAEGSIVCVQCFIVRPWSKNRGSPFSLKLASGTMATRWTKRANLWLRPRSTAVLFLMVMNGWKYLVFVKIGCEVLMFFYFFFFQVIITTTCHGATLSLWFPSHPFGRISVTG